MPRPAAIDAPVKLHTSLPESEYAWLMAHLFSDVDGRVPPGAVRQWLRERLAEYRGSKVLDLAPYGAPGLHLRGPAEAIDFTRRSLERSTLAAAQADLQEHAG